jgi:hypothetical protein
MLKLFKYNCGCIGTSSTTGKAHLTTSCEIDRGSSNHFRGTFLLRNMKGKDRSAMNMTEIGMELLKFQPETKETPSMPVIIEHLHQMEDNPQLFREAIYALSQVKPLLFSTIAARVRGLKEGYDVEVRMLLGQGTIFPALKLIRETTGMPYKDAKLEVERIREDMR